MTMRCPELDEIARYVDGELSVNRTRDLDRHLAGCRTCVTARDRLGRMVARLAPGEEEFDEPELRAAVLRRIRTETSPPRRSAAPPLRWLLPVAAFAAVALVVASTLLLRHAEPPQQPRFFARGSARPGAERWVDLYVFRRRATSGYEEVGEEIPADAQLVFGYRNAAKRYRFLMVLGIDHRRRVYWYFPAYERASTDPKSIAIREGRHELSEEIEHDLAPGTLCLVALFSMEPLRVSRIEQIAARADARRGACSRLPLAGTGQLVRSLRVSRPSVSR